MNNDQRPAYRSWARPLLGVAITLACAYVFVRQINFSDVRHAFVDFNWVYLIFGVCSLALGYVLRINRWATLLRAAGADATFNNCAGPFLGSIALNNVLPLRLGDVVRALIFPRAMGISKVTATSSLVIERLIDLMTLLASFAIGLFAVQAIDIPQQLRTSALSLAVLGGVVLVATFLFAGAVSVKFARLASRNKASDAYRLTAVFSTLSNLLQGINVMSRPRLLLGILSISMLIWVCEAGLFYFVLQGAGLDGSAFVAFLIMAIATLSTLIPSSPGYVGSFHLAAFTAVSLVGGNSAQAASYAVIVHLALWLPTTLAGALALWSRPELFRATQSQTALS